MDECTYQSIRLANDTCNFVRDNCKFQYFSLLTFNYCTLNNFPLVTFVLIIILIVLCFYFLSTTGNDHLAPALGIMSEKLGLSQNLAGLTLLALGNQAPDVIVAFVLGDSNNEGVETSFGPVLGSGLLVVGFVLSTVVYLGKTVTVLPGNYIRDLLVYQLSMVYVFVLGWTGKIKLYQGIIFFVIYFMYVGICFVMDKKKKEEIQKIEDNALLGIEDGGKPTKQNLDYKITLYKRKKQKRKGKNAKPEELKENIPDNNDNLINEDNDDDDGNNSDDSQEINTEEDLNSSGLNLEEVIHKSYVRTRSFSREPKQVSRVDAEIRMYQKFQYNIIKNYLNKSVKAWNDMSTFQKVIFLCVDYPFNILRDLTIPPYEKDKWKRKMFICQPIAIIIFLIVIFNLYSYVVQYWYVFLALFIIAGICSVIIAKTSYRTSLPSYEWVLLLSAFVLSILWLWSVSSILIDMIVTARFLLPIELPQAFISMTVLSFGGALPDFIVDTSLARTGYAEMALAGTIGAPVFGITFGLGLCLIKKLITNEDHTMVFDLLNFESNPDSKILVAGMITISIIVIELMISGCVLRFQIKKVVSFIGYGLYACFVLSLAYFTFIEPHFVK